MVKQQKVEASRQYQVPVEKLYQAWNDSEQLKQWWKPMGANLVEVTNELKVGGTVEYRFDKNTFTISGKYEEVKENEKLTYTWNWNFLENENANAAYRLQVTFSKNGDGSALQVTQENIEDQENLHPNEEGWEKGLSDLENFLTPGSSPTGSQKDASVQEEAGYRESPDQLKVGGG